MPKLKSAAKRMRKSEKARVRNAMVRTRLKHTRRALFEALNARNAELSQSLYRAYCSLLDKSAKKGVIKKNTAIRRKKRAAARLRLLESV